MNKVFFFSNIENKQDNMFINNIIDNFKKNLFIKICVDNRNLNITTPCLRINNKFLNSKESLNWLNNYQKRIKNKQNNINKNNQNNNKNNPKQNEVKKENNYPGTYEINEMSNFSDGYSFINNDNALESKFEYINSSNNNKQDISTNLNTINSTELSIKNEKQKFNQSNFDEFMKNRNNDPHINNK